MLATAATAKRSMHSRLPVPVRSAPLSEGRFPRPVGGSMRFARNTEVYGEDDPAEYLYQVSCGVVRTYRMLDDGRRQVVAFYLPGDIFGVEAGDVHLSSAETVIESKLLVVKLSSVLARTEYQKGLSKQLWLLMAQELQRTQQHSLILIKSAEERVASFLLEMANRTSGSMAIELPMTRQDIADYLGLTIETVSRTLTHLVQSGVIELETSRRVHLRNRPRLNRLNA
jgi:CRP/FNR family nitrogen fixation transcriptional regulator